ncbi:siderophore-interacting protein [Burkholderia plantarii]|uniref:siderophore-interacting protein n=1 Tax=Burkholderia plantarii TaxID=41899 RepID=UPI0008706DA6|nr:siderophore-interacting protein [Burkholderia plantarii]
MTTFSRPRGHATGPTIERVRHDDRVRMLRVARIERLTPHMSRVSFVGEALVGFHSLAPDDRVKLSFPGVGAAGAEARRDYTVRRHDAAAGTLVIDFALHDAGPASDWARTARPGDTLAVGGPKGSAVIAGSVRRWLLIGDETALPAIGRRIEEAGAGTRITSLVCVAGAAERQQFETAASLDARWVHRPLSQAHLPDALLAAARQLEIGLDTFLWVAAEASVARALRRHFVDERAHPTGWFKFSGYWVAGEANAHRRLD